jgi:VanZ family protein
MNPPNRALIRALAPLVLMGLIFYLSAQPAGGDHAWWVIVVRKLGHVTGYALLTALWAWALQGVVKRPVLIAVCIALVYACTDEIHQTFVRGRNGSPVDVAVDAIGMAIAVALIHLRQLSPAQRRKIDRGGFPRSSPAR